MGMEQKIKHLEFIQNVITRMNSNSFFIKGWTVTLVSALFAFSAKDANLNYALISYIVIPVFWLLDGFYLLQERQYRDLYREIANKDNNDIDFNMNASHYSNEDNSWLSAILSKTLIPFYGVSIIVTLLVMFLF